MNRAMLLVLGLAAALLAGLLPPLLWPAPPPPALPAAPAAPPPPTVAAASPDRTEGWVATILARPLFDRTRRPPPPPAVVAAAAAGVPRLSGVLVSSSDRFAIFAGADGKLAVAREGGRVGPFTVLAIAPDQVSVLGPGGHLVLRPRFLAPNQAGVAQQPGSPPARSAPPAAPPPAGGSILDQFRARAAARATDSGAAGGSAIPLPAPPSLESLLANRKPRP